MSSVGRGYQGAVLIILSHGGVAPIEEAVRLAAATVLSGPAGGVVGAASRRRPLSPPWNLQKDMVFDCSDVLHNSAPRAK